MKGIINVAAGSTGTTENAELAPLKLFPNPASDQIVLIAPPGSPHTWVMVYDAHGLNVLSTDMRGIGKLDIKALEAGTYSVITTDDHGLPLAREKLVVTH